MALFTPGPLVGQVSGRIGGQIFSHNQGGAYIRTGSIPVNPDTPRQTLIRGLTSTHSAFWSTGLTESGRATWNTWAETSAAALYVNALGLTNRMSGQQAFVRVNNVLVYADLPTTVIPPEGPVPPTPVLTSTPTIDVSTNEVDVGAYVPPAGTYVQVGIAGPYQVGVSRMDLKALRIISTSAVATAVDPADVGADYLAYYGSFVVGMKYLVGVRALNGDGLVSPWVTDGMILAVT